MLGQVRLAGHEVRGISGVHPLDLPARSKRLRDRAHCEARKTRHHHGSVLEWGTSLDRSLGSSALRAPGVKLGQYLTFIFLAAFLCALELLCAWCSFVALHVTH